MSWRSPAASTAPATRCYGWTRCPTTASVRRVGVASGAAALGAFFGLWLGYHHVADIGAILGALLGAGAGAFLACVFTWDT
jgi:hypothetical protein